MSADWPAPRVHAAPGEGTAFLLEISERGLPEVVEEAGIWRHRGTKVTNGLFGVPKTGADGRMLDGLADESDPKSD